MLAFDVYVTAKGFYERKKLPVGKSLPRTANADEFWDMLHCLCAWYTASSVVVGYRTSSGFDVEEELVDLHLYWYELQPCMQDYVSELWNELRESPRPPAITVKRGRHTHSLY